MNKTHSSYIDAPRLGDPDAVLEGQRPREAERRVLPEAQPHGARGRVQCLVALVRPELLHRCHGAYEDSRLAHLLQDVRVARDAAHKTKTRLKIAAGVV